MKRIPRDLSGKDLIKQLKKLGYKKTRQVGSHFRLTTKENGVHHITIPEHDPIKIGTLSNILKVIALHFKISKEELVDRLF
jgi:predicted RNA binding protein YcfA (HicA-like mRNA interferase family)